MDPDVLKKRMRAIYELDKRALRRRSYENQDVQNLYATELAEPNSAAAQSLLHTSYAARGSKRSLLMRFLDCVDRRDATGGANLFHPEGVWSTASPFGDICGASNIEASIDRLPKRNYGPRYMRHRMEVAADIDDLTVNTPTGERCRFDLEIGTVDADGRPRMVIRSLVRRKL